MNKMKFFYDIQTHTHTDTQTHRPKGENNTSQPTPGGQVININLLGSHISSLFAGKGFKLSH